MPPFRSAPKNDVTPGDGGVPGRCKLSVACVTMRVSAGQRLHERFRLRVRLARRGAERRVDLVEK